MNKEDSKVKSLGKVTVSALTRLTDPFTRFLHLQQASGYLLLAATVVALVLANSSYGESFTHFWHTPVDIKIGTFVSFRLTIEQFVNDGLMTIFFTVVGLEIKRELIEGALSSREQAILPVAGALGGMAFPAIIFLCFNLGTKAVSGWAIPTATDIAFSLAVIQMLGKRVPVSLKVFLTALAVVDDLGAIIVIAVFYTSQIHWIYFGTALLVVAVLFAMNRANVRNVTAYFFVGAFLWLSLHEAGVHATISGVILALCVPFRFKDYEQTFYKHLTDVQCFAEALGNGEEKIKHELRDEIIEEMQQTSNLMEAPLNNMLHMLHSVSGFIIMPLFALCNAGVMLNPASFQNLLSPLSLGIFFALIFGKSIGITLTTYVTSRLGITKLPDGVKVYDMFLVNILAGIGFTMSIFVTNLAFSDAQMIDTAKLSIIISSVTAGLAGFLLIRFTSSNPQ